MKRSLLVVGAGLALLAPASPATPNAEARKAKSGRWHHGKHCRRHGGASRASARRHRCHRTGRPLGLGVGLELTSPPGGSAGSDAGQSPQRPGAEGSGTPPPTEPPPTEPPPTEPPPTEPPNTTITSTPLATSTDTTATFAFAANVAGSTFQCSLDESSWAECSSPTAYTGLAVGTHRFSVRARSAAGEVDPSPALFSWAVEPSSPPAPPPPECSTVVASISAAQDAISAADPGDVVCLADGTYGKVSLSASKASQVTLQAEHPGGATINGAVISGSKLTLARFKVTDEVLVQEGSDFISIEHNRISGGYFGIDACNSTRDYCSDERIVGNQFIGPYGEDGIRANRYHDGDGDGIGLLVEGNEFTQIRENGNHSDCIQSVWAGDHLVFRRNYEHDNRCQGVFIKDQDKSIEGIRLEDNLILRNNEPPDPSCPECGQPNTLNLYGPYSDFTMTHNTIWAGEPTAAFRTQPPAGTLIDSNVAYRFTASAGATAAAFTNNTYCELVGSWPTGTGDERKCSLPFQDPVTDDYRLGNGRGVDWAPSEVHFGP
jgi:hypothetical protein